MKMNLPNKLTVLRLCLVPVIVIVGMLPASVIPHLISCVVCAALFIATSVTDMLDGKIARRDGLVTDFGKFLDPVADKLMQCTVLVGFYIKDIIPIWFVIPFFAKELFTLIMGMLVIRKRSVVVVSKWYGKMTVCVFYATIVIAAGCADALRENLLLAILVFTPAVICAIGALIAYVKHYAGLKNEPKAGKLEMNGDTTTVVKD